MKILLKDNHKLSHEMVERLKKLCEEQNIEFEICNFDEKINEEFSFDKSLSDFLKSDNRHILEKFNNFVMEDHNDILKYEKLNDPIKKMNKRNIYKLIRK